MTTRLLTIKEVSALTTLSRSAIYRRMDAGTFPQSIQIGPRRIAFRAEDVEASIDGAHEPRVKRDPPDG